MKSATTRIVIGCLLCLTILLAYQLTKAYRSIDIETANENNLMNQFSFNLKYAHIDNLPENMYVKDSSGNQILLKDIAGSGGKLIYKFYEGNCSKCIEAGLKRLNALSDSIGTDKIVVLGTFSNVNNISIFRKSYHIQFQLYGIPSEYNHLFSVADKAGVPYLFLLDNGLNTKMVFLSEKGNNLAQTLYYNLVQTELMPARGSNIVFTSVEHDFEMVKQGETKKCVFTFLNATKKRVVIENVETSCECTSVNYNKEPVMPGARSAITVKFEAKEAGDFVRDINIYFDQGKIVPLQIKGWVVQ